MQEFLQKLRDNPRIVVVTLIAAGVIALAFGGGDANEEANTDQTNQDTISATSDDSSDGKDASTVDDDETQDSTEQAIGSTPSAGPVDVEREESAYKSTVRAGDNQTVIVRQMVNDYLSDTSQSLSAEQRLYVETVVVNTLPRNNTVLIGDVIEVNGDVLASAVEDSGDLTQAQLDRWSAYL